MDKDSLVAKFTAAGIELHLEAAVELQGGTPPSSLDQTLHDLHDALQRNPDSPEALNNLAWLLATLAGARPEQGREAVQVAERAYELTKGHSPDVLDTLGAAYAQAGQFDRAIESARKGLKLAEQMGRAQLGKALRERIRVYESRMPFLQPPRTGT